MEAVLETLNATAANSSLNATTTLATTWPVNTTIPWDDPVAMGEVVKSWMMLQHLPPAKHILLALTWVLYVVVTATLSYTLWDVLAILVLSEAPQASFANERNVDIDYKDDDAKAQLVIVKHERQYSKNVFRIARHLIRQAGRFSFLRGIACSLCISMAGGVLMATVGAAMVGAAGSDINKLYTERHTLAQQALNIALQITQSVPFATWYAAHAHIVVTTPTLRIWTRRLTRFWPTLKATLLPLLATIFSQEILGAVMQFLHRSLGVAATNESRTAFQTAILIILWTVQWLARLSLVVPMRLALTRIYLSLLPEDEETIVPIDRSFGTRAAPGKSGYAPPGILAKPVGAITFRQALQSLFKDSSYKHALILYAQMLLLELVVTAAFWPFLGRAVLPGWYWTPGPF